MLFHVQTEEVYFSYYMKEDDYIPWHFFIKDMLEDKDSLSFRHPPYLNSTSKTHHTSLYYKIIWMSQFLSHALHIIMLFVCQHNNILERESCVHERRYRHSFFFSFQETVSVVVVAADKDIKPIQSKTIFEC